MTDVLTRLRYKSWCGPLHTEAADEIDRLRSAWNTRPSPPVSEEAVARAICRYFIRRNMAYEKNAHRDAEFIERAVEASWQHHMEEANFIVKALLPAPHSDVREENERLKQALRRIADDDVDRDLKGNAGILSGIAWAALDATVIRSGKGSGAPLAPHEGAEPGVTEK